MIRESHPNQGSPAGSRRWQSILWIVAIALIYFLVARFSLSFIFKPEEDFWFTIVKLPPDRTE